MPTKRNYRSEYTNYQGKPSQIKKRASRNSARAKMVKAGKASKGDGKDVHHVNGRPLSNSMKNLRTVSKRANRSFARNSSGGKRGK